MARTNIHVIGKTIVVTRLNSKLVWAAYFSLTFICALTISQFGVAMVLEQAFSASGLMRMLIHRADFEAYRASLVFSAVIFSPVVLFASISNASYENSSLKNKIVRLGSAILFLCVIVMLVISPNEFASNNYATWRLSIFQFARASLVAFHLLLFGVMWFISLALAAGLRTAIDLIKRNQSTKER